MKPFDEQNLEQQIKSLPWELEEQRDRQVLNTVLQRYRQSNKKPSQWNEGKRIMFRRITKFSIAASVLLAIGLVMFFLGDGAQGSNVLWAGLVERIYAVDTCSHRMQTEVTMDGIPVPMKTEALVYESTPLGMRMDTYMNGVFSSTTYALVKGGEFINVIPALKRVQKSILPMSAPTAESEQGPKFLTKAFLAGEHEKLGESEIDGVPVEGIRALKPKFIGHMFTECTGTLWVDKANGWPYRLEIEGTAAQGRSQMKMIYDQFQWDIPLEVSLFEPNIPADYTETEFEAPKFTEDELIKGLQCFSDNAGGHYPSTLDMQTVMTEFFEKAAKHNKDLFKTPTSSKNEESIGLISGAFAFYGIQEVQEKDPAYYGDKVKAADGERILVRWRLEDGSYRVVYGDLHAETMSKEQLIELEGSKP